MKSIDLAPTPDHLTVDCGLSEVFMSRTLNMHIKSPKHTHTITESSESWFWLGASKQQGLSEAIRHAFQPAELDSDAIPVTGTLPQYPELYDEVSSSMVMMVWLELETRNL